MDKAKHDVEQYLKKKGFSATFEVPKNPEFGDFAIACFTFAKELKKNPAEVAKELASELQSHFPKIKIAALGPYINFLLDRSDMAKDVVAHILKEGEDYGKKKQNGKTIVIDYSAPNIAKPFGIGHLRSTVIGAALYRIYTHLGYKCVGINHLGDWGTQFGKLIAAYKKWGDERKLDHEPIKELLRLYVKFHEEAEKDKTLDEEGRYWFKRLEEGDKEAHALWKRFIDLSLKEFNKIYAMLNVSFDSYNGESFYNDKMEALIARMEKKGLTQLSEGALIVDLEQYGMPACLLKKSDGATLYATRDLAALFYRMEHYHPEKIIYVVGAEQKMHFRQFFKVAELFDKSMEGRMVHVDFGLYRFPEGKMSTRKGNIIFMEDVLDKSIQLAADTIKEKNPNLKNQEVVAKEVGIGAIIFADLSTDRVRDVVFDWEKILSFEGETGPYIQYSHVRINSILEKAGYKPAKSINYSLLKEKEEEDLIKKLFEFNAVLEKAASDYKPTHITRYLLDLSARFNEFYHACPVLKAESEDLKSARLALIDSTRIVLKVGLNLLGIAAPEKM